MNGPTAFVVGKPAAPSGNPVPGTSRTRTDGFLSVLPPAAVSAIAALVVAVTTAFAAASPQHGSWSEGSAVGNGWTVETAVHHPEFIRLLLKRDNSTAAVEIVAGNSKASETCTPAYCVQNAPGGNADREVMKMVASLLPQAAASGFPAPRQAPPHAADAAFGTYVGPAGLIAGDTGAAVLLAAIALLMIPVFSGLCAAYPVRGRHTAYTVAVGALLVAFLWWNDVGFGGSSGVIPGGNRGAPQLVGILQDGNSNQNLLHLYGKGVHGSPLGHGVAELLPAEGTVRLPAVVGMHRKLTVINTAMFFAIGSAVTGSIPIALPLAVVFHFNYATKTAADSEYPAAPATLMMLLAFICAAVLARHQRIGKFRTGATLAAVTAVSAAAAGFRTELAVPAILTVISGAATVLAPDLTRSAAAMIYGYFQTMAARPRKALIPAAVVLIAGTVAFILEQTLAAPASWMAGTFNPLEHSFSTVWSYVTWFLPATLIVLIVAGFIKTLRRPVVFFMMPVSALIMLRLHAAGAGSDFNHWMRLLTVDVPLLMLLSLFGMSALASRIDAARTHGFWKRFLPVAISATTLLFPATALNPGQFPPAVASNAGSIMMYNPAIEVNFLLEAVRSNPDCTIVTKVLKNGRYQEAYFGRGLEVTSSPPVEPAGCRLAYRSLDCNFKGGTDCSDIIGDAPPVNVKSFTSVPYGMAHPYSERPHNDSITIGLYRKR